MVLAPHSWTPLVCLHIIQYLHNFNAIISCYNLHNVHYLLLFTGCCCFDLLYYILILCSTSTYFLSIFHNNNNCPSQASSMLSCSSSHCIKTNCQSYLLLNDININFPSIIIMSNVNHIFILMFCWTLMVAMSILLMLVLVWPSLSCLLILFTFATLWSL